MTALPFARFGLAPLLLAAPLTLPSLGSAQCEEQTFFHPTPEDLDGFGWCVDVVGDLAVIGCPGDDSACPTDPNCNSGNAFIYERIAGVWTLTAELDPADNTDRNQFGQDVSIWGDRVVVTAHIDDEGSAYVFRKLAGAWTLEQKLKGSQDQLDFHFGHSCNLAGDTLLIGVMRDTAQGNDTGSAYLFEYANGAWVESVRLTASNAAGGARFGRAVASTPDWAFVGAPFMDQVGNRSGAVYVYERQDPGTPADPLDDSWPETQLLLGSDTSAQDFFGRAIAVEGDTLIVSANTADAPGAPAGGSVYVFERQQGQWVQVQQLFASDADDNDQFGMSLELDGDRLLVGARFDDEAAVDAGAVYLFERPSGGAAGWVETRKFLASDATAGAAMGDEMAISLWGTTAFVGARFSQNQGNLAGQAYVLDLAGCIGDTYCVVTDNSTGAPGRLEGRGTVLTSSNGFSLEASGLPLNQFGYFLVSPDKGFFPLAGTSSGNLCLNGPIGRYVGNVFTTGGSGGGSLAIDLSAIPVPVGPPTMTLPGDLLNFQAWHRDSQGGSPTSNFTEAIEVLFR